MTIERAISIQTAINDVLYRQSAFLGMFPKPSPRTPEETWMIDYEYGLHRSIQVFHDIAVEHGAYCYCDE